MGDDPLVSCVGRSEERGVGVCVDSPGFAAVRTRTDTIDGSLEFCNTQFDAPCALLVMRHDDGSFWETASATVEQSCRLYASLYPDDFACVGADWVPLE
ncbi:MAG: hypothetical protein DRJ42_27170 [Deltaproteobacteria bacterium]|nr:MAG: hypothetical protein DRJ42_27170 [Deltaproteobacteria bacterium]